MPLPSMPSELSRRSFLRRSAMVSGWLTLSRLTLPAAAAAESAAPVEGLRVLSPHEASILTAIGERMTFTGDPSMPTFSACGALQTVDQALLCTDDSVRQQLGWLLVIFDWAPVLFDFRMAKFTSLPAEAQDEYIRGWALSRFEFRRIAFQALKNISMLGYYSQDATWKGISYRGPWAPRPRRKVEA